MNYKKYSTAIFGVLGLGLCVFMAVSMLSNARSAVGKDDSTRVMLKAAAQDISTYREFCGKLPDFENPFAGFNSDSCITHAIMTNQTKLQLSYGSKPLADDWDQPVFLRKDSGGRLVLVSHGPPTAAVVSEIVVPVPVP